MIKTLTKPFNVINKCLSKALWIKVDDWERHGDYSCCPVEEVKKCPMFELHTGGQPPMMVPVVGGGGKGGGG